jgi:hypothetical protein
MSKTVNFTIDGQSVTANKGETILRLLAVLEFIFQQCVTSQKQLRVHHVVSVL